MKKKRLLFIYGGFESYGIEYLSSYLKKYGIESDLFFFSKLWNDSILYIPSLANIVDNIETENLFEKIRKYQPIALCFSVVSNDFLWASSIAKTIKKEFPCMPIVFGGIHPTLVPKMVMKDGNIDFVCEGDGEETLRMIVESIISGIPLYEIPNLWYRLGGKIISPNKFSYYDITRESITPNKEIFYKYAPYFRTAGTYMFTRGCYYRCSYCCHSALKKNHNIKFQNLSVESAIDQLEEMKNLYSLKKIIFDDDLFIFDREWSMKFLEEYRKKIGLPFFAVIHPLFVDEGIIYKIKESGCAKLEIAVQTFNEEIRKKVLYRNESDMKIKKAIKIIEKSGIEFNIQHIMGIPGTTIEDEKKAALFYSKTNVKRIFSFFLTYYPGCAITQIASKNGIISEKRLNEIYNGKVGSYEIDGDIPSDIIDDYKAMRLIFSMIPIFPGFVIRFFLRGERFKSLSKFSVFFRLVDLVNTFFSMELTAKIYIKRYLYHIPRLIVNRLLKNF